MKRRGFIFGASVAAIVASVHADALTSRLVPIVLAGRHNPYRNIPDLIPQPAFITSPCVALNAWAAKGYPTVQVEKGWGTGIIQDLFPMPAPGGGTYLFTKPFGGGIRADVWQAGAKLLVNIPYNQGASDPSTGQPSQLDPTERVLLDLSIPNCPRFAGYLSGSQDSHQNATLRGYSIPQTMVTTSFYTVLSLDALNSGEDYYPHQATDNTKNLKLNGGNSRFFPDWASSPVGKYAPLTMPQLKMAWSRNTGDQAFSGSKYAMYAQVWGVTYPEGEANTVATSGTVKNINIFGPTNSLRGYQHLLGIWTTDITKQIADWTGPLVALSAGMAVQSLTANQFSIAYPFPGSVISFNETTLLADIPIRLFGRPNTAYQASWNGGSFVSIGTTGTNGLLSGVIPSQAIGNGTLAVREGGAGTQQTVARVAVGYNLVALGESNPAGRYDAVNLTIPSDFLRIDGFNWQTGAQGLSEAVPATGGSGNVVGDTLTTTGGTGTAATLTVAAVDGGGGVTAVTNNSPGSNTLNGNYTVLPSNPVTVTSSRGGITPPTLNCTWGVSNEYWKLIAQYIYNKWSCVVNVTKSALGGTTLFNANTSVWGNWDPNNPGTGSTSTRMFYQSLGPMLWNQLDFNLPNQVHLDLGLNDASVGTTQANYYNTAKNMLAQYRAQLASASFTITIICCGADTATAAANLDAIRAAQIQLWNDNAGFLPGGSFAHLPFGPGAQDPHFVTQAQKQAAVNVVMRNRTASGGSGRAPQIVSAVRVGDTITFTFQGGVGPLTVAGLASDKTGWAATDGNGARTVLAVTVPAANKYAVQFDQVLTSNVATKFCSGATGVGTTCLDSDLVTPCPPEPFNMTVS